VGGGGGESRKGKTGTGGVLVSNPWELKKKKNLCGRMDKKKKRE